MNYSLGKIKTKFNKIFFFNIFSTLSYLLPLALISGPFFSDLIVSTVALYFIILTFKEDLWHYYNNSFFYLFSIFYFCILLS